MNSIENLLKILKEHGFSLKSDPQISWDKKFDCINNICIDVHPPELIKKHKEFWDEQKLKQEN